MFLEGPEPILGVYEYSFRVAPACSEEREMRPDSCQFIRDNMKAASVSETGPVLWRNLRRMIWHTVILRPLDFMAEKLNSTEPWRSLKKHIWCLGVFGPSEYLSRVVLATRVSRSLTAGKRENGDEESGKGVLHLHPGDWVEVKQFGEIFATLNGEGKLRGLAFTKEMMQYCGRRFRVLKRLEKIILESTGETRTIKTPTVILENVVCNGEAHGGCDRTCFCFWREAWLRRVPSSEKEE